MNRRSLYFESPRHVSIREETLPPLAPGQVLVKTLLSAISPGTEMLIYRGEAPTDLPADETISSLHGDLHFPLKYGYSTVGRVESLGEGVDPVWRDKLVFAFNPHETHFMADTSNLMMLPVDLTPEDGIFLPNMETAVNFLHDGAPLVGEQVIVFGQGIVGLLTTSLLARIPLSDLITLDRYASRSPSRFESRAGFFASTRDECLSPRVRLECNPEIPVTPGEEHWLLDTSLDEVYWPCSHSRAIPSFPSQLEWKIGLAWANTRGSLNSPS